MKPWDNHLPLLIAACVFDDESPRAHGNERSTHVARLRQSLSAALSANDLYAAGFAVADARRALGWMDPAVQQGVAQVLTRIAEQPPSALALQAAREAVSAVRGVGNIDLTAAEIEMTASRIARASFQFEWGAECACRAMRMLAAIRDPRDPSTFRAYEVAFDCLIMAGEALAAGDLTGRLIDLCHEVEADPSSEPAKHWRNNLELDLAHVEYLTRRHDRQSDHELVARMTPDSGTDRARAIRADAISAKLLARYGDKAGTRIRVNRVLAALTSDNHATSSFNVPWLCEILSTLLQIGDIEPAARVARDTLASMDAERLPLVPRISRAFMLAAIALALDHPAEAIDQMRTLEPIVDQLPQHLRWLEPTLRSNIAVAELLAGNAFLARQHLEWAQQKFVQIRVGVSTVAVSPDTLGRMAIAYNLAKCDERDGNVESAIARLREVLKDVDPADIAHVPLGRQAAAYHSFLLALQNAPTDHDDDAIIARLGVPAAAWSPLFQFQAA